MLKKLLSPFYLFIHDIVQSHKLNVCQLQNMGTVHTYFEIQNLTSQDTRNQLDCIKIATTTLLSYLKSSLFTEISYTIEVVNFKQSECSQSLKNVDANFIR